MDIRRVTHMTPQLAAPWRALLQSTELHPDALPEYTVLVWDGDHLAATGSRIGSILQYIAVSDDYQGQGLSATVVTELRQEAFSRGLRHLFLYTKPKNRYQFEDLFFYRVAGTADVLLMEDRRNGAADFAASLAVPEASGRVGALVMHCDPFTRGHRYLIETAAAECDHLYVFVLSEDAGFFPAADRMAMVHQGTRDLPHVTVCPTGPYLISHATFPTYFLRESADADAVRCQLDIEVFGTVFAPALRITRRYVGTEPLSPVTAAYNRELARLLPPHGIELREIPRLTSSDHPISASAVRALLGTGDTAALAELVPETTLHYLQAHHYM